MKQELIDTSVGIELGQLFITSVRRIQIMSERVEEILFSLGILTILIVILAWGIPAHARLRAGKRVSLINTNAIFTTNRGALIIGEKVLMSYLLNVKFVDINFIEEGNLIVIKPTNTESKTSVRIRRSKNGKVGIIVKEGLLRRVGKSRRKGRYFRSYWSPARKAIIINFDSPKTRKSLEQSNKVR